KNDLKRAFNNGAVIESSESQWSLRVRFVSLRRTWRSNEELERLASRIFLTRSNDILTGRQPAQPVLSPVVGLNRLNDPQCSLPRRIASFEGHHANSRGRLTIPVDHP